MPEIDTSATVQTASVGAIRRADSAALAHLQETADRAREYVRQSKAANTRRAYRADWEHFTSWCMSHGCTALPAAPETVALYLSDLAETHKPATLQRRLSAISQAHQVAGLETPTKHEGVRSVWAGIRRVKGVAQDGAAPVLVEDLQRIVVLLPDGLRGERDRALLLLGFATSFRRSELVALDVEDLEWKRDGLAVLLRRSKTDQDGEGRKVGVPYGQHKGTCPCRAVKRWLAASGIADGALFRGITRHGKLLPDRLSDLGVSRVVKRAVEAAGLDPEHYSGHSLRAGFVTSAAGAGVDEASIMKQTGHRSSRVLRKYVREANLFRNNAAGRVGL